MTDERLYTKRDMMLAYLAGYFDGEGCVSVTASRKGKHSYPQYTLIFSQSDRAMCELFQNELGCGRIYQLKHYDNAAVKSTKTAYQWRANNSEAVHAAMLLARFCKFKKQQMIEKILAPLF